MKKSLKIFLIVVLSLVIMLIGVMLYLTILASDVKLDESKLNKVSPVITYYDNKNNVILEESNGVKIYDDDYILEHTKNAFISIEDKRFYKHNGIDYRGLIRASINNLKSFSFKEGASTITQQLIKNTHLSNEKTIKRKVTEIKLSKKLEKIYDKEKILEAYLDSIYFGEGCYGISAASNYYFNKKTSELDINESAALAGIVKAPSNYSPVANFNKCNDRKNLVLKEMFLQGYISQNEYEEYKSKNLTLNILDKSDDNDFLIVAKKEINKIIEKSPYGKKCLNIYTTFDADAQKKLTNVLLDNDNNSEKSAVLMSKDGKVMAFYSTCGEPFRQLGSAIKPIAVYGPAIETNTVSSATLILDELTDFNGYKPSNYNDKYYGYISVKDSLAKSLNVCSAKILNYTGVDKALSYLSKTEIPVSETDKNLSLALGATECGATLMQLTNAYNVFNNDGIYSDISVIEKVTTEKGDQIYSKKQKTERIFSKATIDIMNDILEYTVTNGTAKKLSFTEMALYGKTGTVGTKNGNTDAYCISYNNDYSLGVWYGNRSDCLLENSISGGSLPAINAAEFWKEFYKNKTPPKNISRGNDVEEVRIDKISYNEDNEIILADELAPERYVATFLCKKSALPKKISSRFSKPKIEKGKILVNDCGICIQLCLTEYYDALIYRIEKSNKKVVYDTFNNKKSEFIDTKTMPDTEYQYIVVPYFNYNGNKILGEELILDKIKSPGVNAPDDEWWLNDE